MTAAMRLKPDAADLVRQRADIYDQGGRYLEAIADRTAYIAGLSRQDAARAGEYMWRGDTYQKAGRLAEAIADYDRALSDPSLYWRERMLRQRSRAKAAAGDSAGAAADMAAADALAAKEQAERVKARKPAS